VNIFKGIIIVSLSFSLCNAESNETSSEESYYVDDMHKNISQSVIEWADILDVKVSSWLIDSNTTECNTTTFDTNTTVTSFECNTTTFETNTTAEDLQPFKKTKKTNTTVVKSNRTVPKNNGPISESNVSVNTLEDKVNAVDQFFQNDRYLDQTENTYIRVRLQSYLQTKDSNDFDLKLRAQAPFSRSRKHLKIFIDDLTVENADNTLQDVSNDDTGTPDIGLHYYAPIRKIRSRYSVGLSGIDPFVKARYNMPIMVDEWRMDTVQLFEYSTDDKFEEETNFYFDRSWSDRSLVRVQLHRSTHQETDGMDYFLSAQYFKATKIDAGFGIAQSFYGNTKYEYTVDTSAGLPETETFGGINSYVTTLSWRENIWRKWFYYEIRPSVSFERQYDYEPNYRALIFLDFYFGKHH
jgi:hypothetical protein